MNTVQRVNTPSQRVVPPPRTKAKPPAAKPKGATTKQQQQPKASKGWFGWGGPSKRELAQQKQINKLQSEINNLQSRKHQASNTKIDNLEIQAVRAQFTIQKLEKDLDQQRNSLLKKVKRLRQENEKAKAMLATELQIKDVDMQMQAKELETLQEALTKETTINKLKILHLESSLQHVENERKTEHDRHQRQLKKLQYQLQVRDQLLTEKEESIHRLEAAHPARARIARLETTHSKKKNTKNVQQLRQQKDSHQVALQNSLRHLRSSGSTSTTNQKADLQTSNQLRRELVETKKKLLAAQKRIRSLLGQQQHQPKNGEPSDAFLKDLYDTKVRLKKALDRIYELEHC